MCTTVYVCMYVCVYVCVCMYVCMCVYVCVCVCVYDILYILYSVVEDYAKWHMLVHALSLYTAPLPRDSASWEILRNVKFPKTSKLSDKTMFTCIEYLESIMPLALARPFVEEFITDSMKIEVQLS